MKRKHRRNKGASLVDIEANRVRAEMNWLDRLVGSPPEIQELKRIVDEFNAPPPPVVAWTST